MNRKEKEVVVANLIHNFNTSEAAFIIQCNMNAQEVQSFKKVLKRETGAVMHVAKNTLLHIAAESSPIMKNLKPFFQKQITLVFAPQNGTSVAALIKKQNSMPFVVGTFQGAMISKDRFNFFANIPGREVLLAQLCGVLSAPIAQLACLLKAISEKK